MMLMNKIISWGNRVSSARQGFYWNMRQISQINAKQSGTTQRNFLNNSYWEKNDGNRWLGSILAAGVLSGLLLMEEQRRREKQTNCFWSKSSTQRNKINGRIATSEYQANDPIEDRYHCKQLKTIDAYVCALFDGHGGWGLSEYAKNLLINEIDFQLEQLKKLKFDSEDAYIIEALNRAFDYIENSFYEIALSGKIERPFNTGSCALVTLVKDNKVYSANAGDCKGVVVGEEKKGFTVRKINHKQNANSKKEQARLQKQFPNDKDIVVCKRGGEGACYVKGRLMPTRSFGDFHLKHPKLYKGKGKFNGPYISHRPEIIIHELRQSDKYIIMASDGLWDEMKKNRIGEITYQNKNDKSKVVTGLFNDALEHAAKDAGMTVKELAEVPPGQRRQFHDDITIICIDLDNQYQSK